MGVLHRRRDGVFVWLLLVHMLFEAEGPVWAIAKLSFKEASRSQLLWVFLLIFLPFLFPTSVVRPRSSRPTKSARLVDVTSRWMFTSWSLVPRCAARVVLRHPQRHQEPEHLHGRVQAGRAVRDRARPVRRIRRPDDAGAGRADRRQSGADHRTRRSPSRPATRRTRPACRSAASWSSRAGRWISRERTSAASSTTARYIGGHPDSPQRAIWHFTTFRRDLAPPEGDRVPSSSHSTSSS